MILLLKLILAHIIGDFILQPKKWVKSKEKRKISSWELYAHVLIHGILLSLLLNPSEYWELITLVMITHFIIDVFKIYFQKQHTKLQWFIADQLLHLTTLIGFTLFWLNAENAFLEFLRSDIFIILFTSILFLSKPTSIIISQLIKPWSDAISDGKEQSLQNAGNYIGILERLFVFIFIYTNHWEAVGFLLATKSVFRFGDLKESKERKLTEYILIGTLLSFGTAIVVGLIAVFIY